MKHFIYKCTALLVFLGVFTSCNPDLTEVNPNYLDSSKFWKNLDDTSAGLNATYATLGSQYILNVREEALRSDIAWFGSIRPAIATLTGAASPDVFARLTVNSSNLLLQRNWDANYRGIFRANQVIDALQKLEGKVDAARWKQQMGEARFLRALFSFYLQTVFNRGEIIIYDKLPITTTDFLKPVSTSEEVSAFIRADLQYAYDNLAPVQTVDKGRATKGAAATVLGTSYLYDASENNKPALYEKASEYFTYVIANYTLEQDVTKMHTTAGEFNSESIFEVNHNDQIRPDLGPFDEDGLTNRLAFLSINGSQAFTLTSWAALAYKTEPMDDTDPRNHVGGILTNPLKSVPLRAAAKVALIDDVESVIYPTTTTAGAKNLNLANKMVTGTPYKSLYITTGTNIPTNANNGNPYNATRGFGFFKIYTNHDIVNATDATPNLGGQKSSKNMVLFRLSDVYLMQAECFIAKGGKTQEAIDLINKIRSRWGLKLLGMGNASKYINESFDDASLLRRLQDIEKPLEMSIEGHASRFIDLRRWHLLSPNTVQPGRTGSRFQELNNLTLYTVDFNFFLTNTTTQINYKNTAISKTRGIPLTGDIDVVNYEFNVKLANFTSKTANTNGSEYYDIPDSEKNTNPNLFKK